MLLVAMTAKNDLLESVEWYTSQDGAAILRDDVIRFVAHRCQTAVLFNSEISASKPLFEFGTEMAKNGLVQLPYDDTLFCARLPSGERFAALCCVFDGSYYWHFFREIRNGLGGTTFSPAGWAYVPGDGGNIQLQPMIDKTKYDDLSGRMDNAETDDLRRSRDYELQMAQLGVSFVLTQLAALVCKDIVVKDVAEPTKLNRQRERKGRSPIDAYHVISIGAEAKTIIRAERHSGARGVVSAHYRRGHIRKISSGRMVPVAPCIVGSLAGDAKVYSIRSGLH
jgi:hypothetical protein